MTEDLKKLLRECRDHTMVAHNCAICYFLYKRLVPLYLEPAAPLPPPPPPKPKKVRKQPKAPNRPPWLVERTYGYSEGSAWDCLYEGKKWALVRKPGCMYWVSIGQQRYGPTSWAIMRTSAKMWGNGRIIDLRVSAGQPHGKQLLADLEKVVDDPDVQEYEVVEGGRMREDLLWNLSRKVDELNGGKSS